MALVTPTDLSKSVHNRCVIEVFVGVFVLYLDFFIFDGIGVFVIGLSLILSFFSLSKFLAFMMSNKFPHPPSSAPLHTLLKLYDVPVDFVNTPPSLRQCLALFAVAEGLLLLDVG